MSFSNCSHLVLFLVLPSTSTLLPIRMLSDLKKRTNASMERYHSQEQEIMDSGVHLNSDSPAWYMTASHDMTPEAHNLSRKALRRETMAVMLVEALRMSPREAVSVLPSVGTHLVNICSADYLRIIADCKNVDPRYRTHTGLCNNVLYPTRGVALEPYARFLPADYADGVSLPRGSLPSPRAVSVAVHSGGPDLKHPHLMALTALFGQLIAQDLAYTPKQVLPDGGRIKCCDVQLEKFHPECFPIRAEAELGGCMEYARSAPHPGNTQQVRYFQNFAFLYVNYFLRF